MKQRTKNLFKAIQYALLNGLFYGAIGLIVEGLLFAVVGPLFVGVLTLFSGEYMWFFAIDGIWFIVIGAIIAFLLYLYLSAKFNPKDKCYSGLEDVMSPIMIITAFLTMLTLMFAIVIIRH